MSEVNENKHTFWALLALVLFVLGSSLPQVHAEPYHFKYDGGGMTTDSPDIQMKEHICLATAVFLEARGDGEVSQMYHGMVTIVRATNPRRWRDTVCEVILQPNQYEIITPSWHGRIKQVMDGDIFAIEEHIEETYPRQDQVMWNRIMHMTYWLITAPERTEGWIDADHFYSPKSLSRRNMPEPYWPPMMQLVAIAGDTHFLKE